MESTVKAMESSASLAYSNVGEGAKFLLVGGGGESVTRDHVDLLCIDLVEKPLWKMSTSSHQVIMLNRTPLYIMYQQRKIFTFPIKNSLSVLSFGHLPE